MAMNVVPVLCVHELFERQVDRLGPEIAIVSEDGHLTYEELNRRSNQLAHLLRRMKVGPETLVAVFLDRSLELIVSLLGVLKAGGAYVPLDPSLPMDRLAFIMSDCRAPVIITRSKLTNALPPSNSQRINVDTDGKLIKEQPENNPASRVCPENLAYAMYTSGTTGIPKGVLIAHRGLSNVAERQSRFFGFKQGERVIQFSSISFDVSAFEIFLTLVGGATLYIPDAGSALLGHRLIEFLSRHAISIFAVTPSVLASLERAALPRLRTIIAGAEVCTVDVVRNWGIGRNFFNAYGPTECTIETTVASNLTVATKPSIGLPIPNASVFVSDQYLSQASAGASGELLIGGVGLARGYLNRASLTAEVFIPNPFDGVPGSRLFRTGDFVAQLPDGGFDFLGRVDNQIKIRGFRVELEEIEAVLCSHEAVRECAVIATDQEYASRVLVGYVVSDKPTGSLPTELRDWVGSKVPDYMVPASLVVRESLPRTPSGKIDRETLKLVASHSPHRDLGSPPNGQTEEWLASIWRDVLLTGVVINRSADFFTLGGNSLLATRVLSRIRARCSVDLTLRDFLDLRTLADISSVIEQRRKQSTTTRARILWTHGDSPIPISVTQESVWFMHELVPGNLAYNFYMAIELVGNLDVAALRGALSDIIRRHEILRTSFPLVEGLPHQLVHPPWEADVRIEDLRTQAPNARHTLIERIMSAEMSRPFDITKLPLIRWVLIHVSDDTWTLVQSEHHFVHDGWSIGIFLQELLLHYRSRIGREAGMLPELAIQYKDFAAWQREWIESSEAREQLSYWRSRLAGVPMRTTLPASSGQSELATLKGGYLRDEFPPELCANLQDFSLREGVTVFTTMLAAFKAMLLRYTNDPDVIVGSTFANRRLPETESLIGMFVNTVVLRTDLSEDPTVRELLARVRETVLGADANQEFPFATLVQKTQPQRQAGVNPLFQIGFSFHDSLVPPLNFAEDLHGEIRYLHGASAKFDLDVVVTPRSDPRKFGGRDDAGPRMELMWEFNQELYQVDTVRRMMAHFRVLLEAIIADPSRTVSQLALLTKPEIRQQLIDWNDTASYSSISSSLHEEFERCAARTPCSVAVISNRESLTYRALDKKANLLAHYLGNHGIGVEDLVGVCLNRSCEMIVAILGILKAGAAYVPLDPAYPSARLQYMIDQSAARLILAHSNTVRILNNFKDRVVRIDQDWPVIAGQSDTNPNVTSNSSRLAYVMFTSGSTGKPKGVMIEHRGVTNMIAASIDALGKECLRHVAQCASFSFDASLLEVFLALSSGGTLHLLSQENYGLAADLPGVLSDQGITLAALTPTILNEIPSSSYSALATLLVGGEKCSRETWTTWGKGRRIVNVYAPTEASVYCTSYKQSGAEILSALGPPIGKPISGMRAYVLDDNLQLLPSGVPGELYVGGVGLARGYVKSPTQTASAFLPDPHGSGRGERMYKTGDLARYRSDGNFEILGRVDNQVKLRGIRIEPGEIEVALREYPGVRDCVVSVTSDASPGSSLVAYLAVGKDVLLDTEAIRSYLRRALPDYMVPTLFVALSEFPTTATGKVNRRALRDTPQKTQRATASSDVPRTPIEEMVSAIWSEVLGLERVVGIHDDFFELGGHSLLAMRLLTRIEKRFGVRLTLNAIFEFGTMAEIAGLIEQQIGNTSGTLTPASSIPAPSSEVRLQSTVDGQDPSPKKRSNQRPRKALHFKSGRGDQ